MIKLNQTIKDYLNTPGIKAFGLFQIAQHRYTDYFENIRVQGELDTYFNREDEGIISVDIPRLDSVVDKSSYNIALVSNSITIKETLNNNLVGKIASVRFGFINPINNTPDLNPEHILLFYKGQIAAVGFSNKTEALGEQVVSIQLGSPMSNLDRVNCRIMTNESWTALHPTDSTYEQLYEGSIAVTFAWGRMNDRSKNDSG